MRQSFIKKIILTTFIFIFVLQAYAFAEPALATSVTDDVVVTLNVDEGITISNGPDTTMAPHIGVSSNNSIGNSAWTVTTNAANGYTLAVKASTAPALVSGGNSFADYTETVNGTPEQPFTVAPGDKEFGYSAYGTDTSTTTWGAAQSCGSGGTPSSTEKYVGFKTTDKIIATRAGVTPTTGITTTICFAAAQNAVFAPAGTYTATITGTATTL